MTAPSQTSTARTLLSGAIAGSATAAGFAALHHLLISNIWLSLLPMITAGAVCGMCLAWSYRLVSPAPTSGGWLVYNLYFVALFVVLGALSFLLFEPVYTIAGLVGGVELPDDLLRQAIPLSAVFGVLAGVGMCLVRRWRGRAAASIVIAHVVLSVLLGHNAAILGLVHMTSEALPLLTQFYGLIAAIMVGNAAAFLMLERRGMFLPTPQAAEAVMVGAQRGSPAR